MRREAIEAGLDTTFSGLGPHGAEFGFEEGKVRDLVRRDDELVIVTSDRISAFDVVLGTIPMKGELLNRMALYWFDATSDIVRNHVRNRVSPRSLAVDYCEVLPIEVIVRGYLTGSAWRDYQAGKSISGIKLPSGLKADQRFPEAIITPSTKAERGEHDEPISREDILSRGLVDRDLYEEVEKVALALFERGTSLAAERGLILVDTKYEFGIRDGKLVLVDEVHTPDSSRYWFSDEYTARFEAGNDQKKVDKEFLREWLMDRGYQGHGDAPEIPNDVRLDVAEKYIEAFELVTGETFEALGGDAEAELEVLRNYLG